MSEDNNSLCHMPMAPDQHLTFRYKSGVYSRFRPGDRVWICALRLNPARDRFVRNCPPMLVELCCRTGPKSESIARGRDCRAEFLIPVKDGGLDWGKSSGFSDIIFCGSRDTAVRMYDSLLTEASCLVQSRIDSLGRFKLRLEAMKNQNKTEDN